MAAKQKLTYPIVWDELSKAAEAFGLAFTLPEDLREVYRGFGTDLAACNGDPSWRLPVPARFVIDAQGTIRTKILGSAPTKFQKLQQTVDAALAR